MRDDRIISHVFSRDQVVVKVIIGDFASAGRYNEEELVKIKGDAALPTCRKRKHIFLQHCHSGVVVRVRQPMT